MHVIYIKYNGKGPYHYKYFVMAAVMAYLKVSTTSACELLQLKSLQWRRHGCDGVSNHQPHDWRKHQSSASLDEVIMMPNISLWVLLVFNSSMHIAMSRRCCIGMFTKLCITWTTPRQSPTNSGALAIILLSGRLNNKITHVSVLHRCTVFRNTMRKLFYINILGFVQ